MVNPSRPAFLELGRWRVFQELVLSQKARSVVDMIKPKSQGAVACGCRSSSWTLPATRPGQIDKRSHTISQVSALTNGIAEGRRDSSWSELE